ncbi:MAG: hypothetical protein ACC663_07160 [Gammaproteobacteria bacterium]
MIVISHVYHDHAFQAVEQILNYHFFFADEAVHVIHISAYAPSTLVDSITVGIVDLLDEGRVVINPNRLKTVSSSCLPQHYVNFQFAREVFGNVITHVYMHTSGDLLVSGWPAPYIKTQQFGLGYNMLEQGSPWPHSPRAFSSSILDAVSPLRYFGRAEGSFYPMGFFSEVVGVFAANGGMETMLNPGDSWPIEEAIFATMFEATMPGKPHVRNLVHTKNLKHNPNADYQASKTLETNMVTVDDIKSLVSDSCQQPVGLKWFSIQNEDEARAWLKNYLGDISPPDEFPGIE